MAVAMLQSWPGFTQQMYEDVTKKMFDHAPMQDSDAPEGLIVHSAGKTGDGWYVYDIWESREAFERFENERLMPAFADMMGADFQPPEEARPQFYDVEVLVKGR
jgi:quinol monooxygenase YgiN